MMQNRLLSGANLSHLRYKHKRMNSDTLGRARFRSPTTTCTTEAALTGSGTSLAIVATVKSNGQNIEPEQHGLWNATLVMSQLDSKCSLDRSKHTLLTLIYRENEQIGLNLCLDTTPIPCKCN
jgi:hypothetical protein